MNEPRVAGRQRSAAVLALLAGFGLALTAPAPVHAAPPIIAAVDGQVPTLAPLVKKATPAVVNISATGKVEVRNPLMDSPLFEDPFFRRFFGEPDQGTPRFREAQSLGSGVIVDAEQGYILTNAHVVQQADEIEVTLQDEREFLAKVVGADKETDVALLQIEADDLAELPLGDSDSMQVGDFVVAIGNPFGLRHTVTSGIVSAVGRSGIGNVDSYQNYIQTDASINPGNSGGALVDLQGELIGINTAILSRTGGNIGIGFAVPSNLAKRVMDQLIKYGEVERGRLGVIVQNLTPELAEAFDLKDNDGVVITDIEPDSSAAGAGLQAGDVIVGVNGREVRNYRDLRNTIGLLRVGEKVRLEVLREGKRRVIDTKVGAVPEDTVTASSEAEGAEDLHPRLAGATFGNNPEGEGVVVMDVDPASEAARAGLRPDDLILSVNRQGIKDVAAFKRRVEGQDQLLLFIERGRGRLYLALR